MSTWLDAVFTVGDGMPETEKAQCPSVTVQIPHNYRQVHKVVLQGVKSIEETASDPHESPLVLIWINRLAYRRTHE